MRPKMLLLSSLVLVVPACVQLLGNDFAVTDADGGAGGAATSATGTGGAGAGGSGPGGAGPGGSGGGGEAPFSLAHEWSERFGGAGSQILTGLTTDANDQLALVGTYNPAMEFNSEPVSGNNTSAFVAKMSAGGNGVWLESLLSTGMTGSVHPQDIATDAMGNFYTVGFYSGDAEFGTGPEASLGGDPDVFLIRHNLNGGHDWHHAFASEFDDYGIQLDRNDTRVAISGQYQQSINLGGMTLGSPGAAPILVAVYNDSGSHMVSRGFGTQGSVFVSDIAVGAAGNVYITGTFDFVLGVNDTTLMAINGKPTIFLIKLNNQLDEVWARAFGSSEGASANELAVANGQLALVGSTDGPIDFGGGTLFGADKDMFVATFDLMGTHQHSIVVPTPGDSEAISATWLQGGELVVAGNYEGMLDSGVGMLNSEGSKDAFVIGYGDELTPLVAKGFGGTSQELFPVVSATSDGGLVLGLSTSSDIDMGGGVMPEQGGADIVVAKYR